MANLEYSSMNVPSETEKGGLLDFSRKMGAYSWGQTFKLPQFYLLLSVLLKELKCSSKHTPKPMTNNVFTGFWDYCGLSIVGRKADRGYLRFLLKPILSDLFWPWRLSCGVYFQPTHLCCGLKQLCVCIFVQLICLSDKVRKSILYIWNVYVCTYMVLWYWMTGSDFGFKRCKTREIKKNLCVEIKSLGTGSKFHTSANPEMVHGVLWCHDLHSALPNLPRACV